MDIAGLTFSTVAVIEVAVVCFKQSPCRARAAMINQLVN